jgi:hypothetical protein
MKKIMLLTIALLSTVVFAATSYGVDFTDSKKYWGDGAGWADGTAWNTDNANGVWDGNNIDVIGDPDITGGTATFNSTGNLTQITFNYFAPYNDWRMLAPGNLFINVIRETGDTIWDYVVTTMGTASLGTQNGSGITLAAMNYNIYDISSKSISAQRLAPYTTPSGTPAPPVDYNDTRYILSGLDNVNDTITGTNWTNWYLRNNHPIGIQNSVLDGLTPESAYFSGFPGRLTGETDNGRPIRASDYDFGTVGLDTQGHNIIIGWTMTCANDVIYANEIDNPVPEPTTLFLLGLGLIGVAAIRRKF